MSELLGFVPSWCAEFPSDNPALHAGVSWVCLSVSGAPRPVMRPPVAKVATVVMDVVTEVEPLTLELDLATDGELEPLELDAIESPAPWATSEDPVFEFDSDDIEPASLVVTAHAPEDLAAALPYTLLPPGLCDVGDALPEDMATQFVESSAAEPAAPDPFAAYVAAVVEVALAAGHTRAAAALPMLLEGTDFDPAALPEDALARLVSAKLLVRTGAKVSPSDGFSTTAGAWRSVLRGQSSDLAACGDSTLDGWSADLLKAFGVGQGNATDVRRELRRRGVAAFGMLLAA